MHHTITAGREHLHAHFSARAKPVLTIESGDTVTFRDVPDVGWGLEPPTSTTAPRRKVEPRENGPCLCGPVAVRGAEPGDTLEIAIEAVRPALWGWTYSGQGMATPAWNEAMRIGESPLTLLRWDMDKERRVATNQFGHRVPVRAFPGTIGLAPDEEHASGWVPRVCGGNMDCRELAAGSTLFLPVMSDGGLLSVGDGHAAQGDGEVSGTAIECGLEEVRVRVRVQKGMRIAGPRVRVEGGWVTLGFGATLDEAAAGAMSGMLGLMVEELGIGRAEAAALASARVSLRVTQMVNPRVGVHALLPDQF